MNIEQTIVNDCNELARTFCEMFGYKAPDDHKFYEKGNPRDEGFWNLAVAAYDHIEGTDVEDCLERIKEGDK